MRRMAKELVTMRHVLFLAVAAASIWIAPALAADPPPAGAASCSGCHPAARFVSTPVPRLNGRNAGEIAAAMAAFKSGERPATVMDRIAKGFSDDEVKAIAAWYGAQKD
jgi:sulfide dehydrogenase cytochrome subunit